MPSTTAPTSTGQRRASQRSGEALRRRRAVHADLPSRDRAATSDARRSLGHYVDSAGRSREVIAERAAQAAFSSSITMPGRSPIGGSSRIWRRTSRPRTPRS